MAGKKHVWCKHRRSNIKRELQKTIKATFGGLGSKLESSLSDSLHDFFCIIKSPYIRFESHIHSGHFLVQLTRGNDHLISLLYCTVLQNLIEADIQSECRRWKMLMFPFMFLCVANELEILHSFVMGESIHTKSSFSSFFFPCHAGSSFLRLFVSVVFK